MESHSTELFQAILYSNFCLTCLLSACALLLIWYKTPKQMKVYRWFLLDIQLCAFCTDLCESILFQPYFMFSHRAYCAVGALKHISSSPWVALSSLGVLFALTGFCVASIFCALVYRVVSIFNLKSKITSTIALSFHFVCAAIPTIPFVAYEIAAFPMEAQIWNDTYQSFPEVRAILVENICVFWPQELALYFEIIALSIFAICSVGLLFCAGMIAASFGHLSKHKASLTPKTYQMHLQFNLSMVAQASQCALPVFTMYIPISAVDIYTVFPFPTVVNSIAILVSLHSSLNALMMICFTGHYRRATVKLIDKAAKKIVNLICRKESQQSVTQVTILAHTKKL